MRFRGAREHAATTTVGACEIRRAAIKPELVDDALRLLHMDVLERGADARELGQWLWGVHWFPHLRNDPRIIALARVAACLARGELCEPQILPQFPHDGLKLSGQPPIPTVMSLEAALGRIDQILQLRQQLLDPGAAGTATASGGAGLAPGAGSGSFATALATAQGAAAAAAQPSGTYGLPQSAVPPGVAQTTAAPGVAQTTAAPGVAQTTVAPGVEQTAMLPQSAPAATLPATPALTGAAPAAANLFAAPQPVATLGAGSQAQATAPSSVQAMIDVANSLVGKPYVWGGGHSGWGAQAGYDCSGFVSAVLHAGGYLTTPQDTQTLPTAPGIEQGPGQYVTIYDRTDAGSASSDHVIIDLAGQFYESGGEQGSWGGGGGVQPIATPPASYLSTFNLVLHPAGL